MYIYTCCVITDRHVLSSSSLTLTRCRDCAAVRTCSVVELSQCAAAAAAAALGDRSLLLQPRALCDAAAAASTQR